MKNIVQFSGGKDSTATLIGLLEKGRRIDEVVFFDTGWEFDCVYKNIEKWQTKMVHSGIPFTVLKPQKSFDYMAFEMEVHRKNGTVDNDGYSWCGGICRWGTTEKLKTLEAYCKYDNQIIGFASDETARLSKVRKGIKTYPLAEWHITESDALAICYKNGVDYIEDGHRLYDILDRGSCFCCGNKNLKELKGMYESLPRYWERLKQMQSKTSRLYKKVGIQALEHRFEEELL